MAVKESPFHSTVTQLGELIKKPAGHLSCSVSPDFRVLSQDKPRDPMRQLRVSEEDEEQTAPPQLA